MRKYFPTKYFIKYKNFEGKKINIMRKVVAIKMYFSRYLYVDLEFHIDNVGYLIINNIYFAMILWYLSLDFLLQLISNYLVDITKIWSNWNVRHIMSYFQEVLFINENQTLFVDYIYVLCATWWTDPNWTLILQWRDCSLLHSIEQKNW